MDASSVLVLSYAVLCISQVSRTRRARPPEPFMIGETISHYRVLEKLGEGGMGIVYKAQDSQLGRHVALKFLPQQTAAGEDALKRFEREACAASSLNHPNILTIYEIGEDRDRHFIAAELVEGESLRERMRREHVEPHEAVTIALQVASALAAAHAAGIVHRDIKPENIMLRPDGIVKLLDFGLAKLTDQERTAPQSEALTEAISRTEVGTVMGTASYMSPEQARGSEVDARTDVYALGAVLYEMTTDRWYSQPASTSRGVEEPSAQTVISPRALDVRIPPELERMILKCLQRSPDDRYASARELEADLRRLITSSVSVPAVPRPRRRWFAITGAALGALLLAGVLIFLLRPGAWRRSSFAPAGPPRIQSLVVLPLENLSGEPTQDYFTDGMTDELIARLAKIAALRVISRTSAMRYKGSKKSLPEIARELEVDAVVEGSVLRSRDRVRINVELIHAPSDRQLWAEGYERDLRDVLALQSEVASAIVREIRIKVAPEEQTQLARARPVTPEAYELYLRGRASWNRLTPESLQEAVRYFQQAIEKDKEYALAYTGVADSYVQLAGRVVPPAEAMAKAKSAALRALELNDSLGEVHASLAQVKLFYDFDWPGAGAEFKRATQLNSGNSVVHQTHGLFLSSAGRFDEALAEADRALELDPLSTSAGCIRGRLLYYARRYDEAIAQYKKTLELDPNSAGSCAWLGYAYLETSRLPEAAAAARQAMDASPNEAQGPAVLVRAYVRMGRKAEAQKVLQQLLQKSRRQFVSPYNLAVAYIGSDNEKALRRLEEACREPAGILVFLNADPAFDGLRSDLRFQDLVRRIGIPAGGSPPEPARH